MPARKKKAKGKRWSAEVTEHSDALSLEDDVFKKRSAADRRITQAFRGAQ
ncbi:MAG TPA: DUF3175 domain-containing protein [Chthoniobacterales bacterium]|nr:DUF3175 domain-containing protein [Chthoniobacterales bacterium]